MKLHVTGAMSVTIKDHKGGLGEAGYNLNRCLWMVFELLNAKILCQQSSGA